MLIYEIIQKEKTVTEKHTKRQSNCYFMNIETNINKLQYELKQITEIEKNINSNIENFLNNSNILGSLIIGYYHFKKCYNIYKDVEFITENRKIILINNDYIKTIKKITNTYNRIIKNLKKNANKDQKQIITQIERKNKK